MKPLEDVRSTKKDSCQRRSNKPLMEKKRRARINTCLTQLKSLVLEGMKKDGSQYSKLEKADILEMTVKHLKNIQAQKALLSRASNTTTYSRYRAGFSQCANEVLRYVNSSPGVKDELKSRLNDHLSRSPINYGIAVDDTTNHFSQNQPNTNNLAYLTANPSEHSINISSVPPLVMSYATHLEWKGNNGFTCMVPTSITRPIESQPTDEKAVLCNSGYHVTPNAIAPSTDCDDANIRVCNNSFSSRDDIPQNIQESNRLIPNLVYVSNVAPLYASTYPQHALSNDKVWRPW